MGEMFWRRGLISSLLFLVLVFPSFSNPVGSLACRAGPDTSAKILMTMILTVYNVFPIYIGNFSLFNWFGLEDIPLGGLPFCICKDPFPRVGLKIGLWEPIAVVEPVRIPWCTPTLPITGGLTGKVPFNAMAIGETSTTDEHEGKLRSLQAHYYRALPWALLEMFLDFACLETRNPFDLGYLTELDPLWQNDMLATILGPEAILFANPITTMACAVDAVTATAGFPLDPLFWCMGSWGSMYPMSGNVPIDDVQASAGVVTRMLFKMHRELILWGSYGSAGLCGRYPMPIMHKRQYSIYPMWPLLHPKRFPIGRHAFIIWGWGKNIPVLNQYNQAWMVYRKRDCCAF